MEPVPSGEEPESGGLRQGTVAKEFQPFVDVPAGSNIAYYFRLSLYFNSGLTYSATQVFVLMLKDWIKWPKRVAFSKTRSFTLAHPFHMFRPLLSFPL